MIDEGVNKQLETKNQKKRSWLHKYMNKIRTGVYQCNVCSRHLHMKETFGNMMRHFKTKHPNIYAIEKRIPICTVTTNTNEIIYEDTNNQNKTNNRPYRSWLHKYIEKIKTGVYQCTACSRQLHMKNTLGNMMRHFRTIHPYIYAKERNDFNLHSDETNEKRFPAKTNIIPQKKQRRRSWVAKYITKIETGIYQCDLCSTRIKMAQGFYNNMKRHFAAKHPVVFESETKTSKKESDVDPIANRNIKDKSTNATLTLLADGGIKISHDKQVKYEYLVEDCVVDEIVTDQVPTVNEVIVANLTNTENDTQYEVILGPNELLEMSDPEIEDKIRMLCQNRPRAKRSNCDKSYFWNFFNYSHGNENRTLYTCLFCDQTLMTGCGSVGNLKRHLKAKHKKAYEIIVKYVSGDDTNESKTTNDSESDTDGDTD